VAQPIIFTEKVWIQDGQIGKWFSKIEGETCNINMCNWQAYGRCDGCSYPFYIVYHSKMRPWQWHGCGKFCCTKHIGLEPTFCGPLTHCQYSVGDRLGKGQAVDPTNLRSECGRSYKRNC
jgi:hypothetical protein